MIYVEKINIMVKTKNKNFLPLFQTDGRVPEIVNRFKYLDWLERDTNPDYKTKTRI